VPLFASGAGLWLLHLLLVVTGDVEGAEPSSVVVVAALANFAWWLGILLIGAGLTLQVLSWDRRWRETGHADEPARDHYA
jgi:hypothetical protein